MTVDCATNACAVDETSRALGVDEIDNPYWAAVKDRVVHDHPLMDIYGGGGLVTERPETDRFNQESALAFVSLFDERRDLCRKYSFTIPDPETLKFLLPYCRDGVLDPMAGTGYWAYLLDQLGVNVLAYDQHPPDRFENFYHLRNEVHFPVRKGHAPWVAKHRGQGRTLLLSWPPPASRDAELTVAAFAGDRIVYIGEGGSCGTPAMFKRLDTHWRRVARHQPVLWDCGVRDFVEVYDRLPPWSIARGRDFDREQLFAILRGLLEDESESEEAKEQARFLINVLEDEEAD